MDPLNEMPGFAGGEARRRDSRAKKFDSGSLHQDQITGGREGFEGGLRRAEKRRQVARIETEYSVRSTSSWSAEESQLAHGYRFSPFLMLLAWFGAGDRVGPGGNGPGWIGRAHSVTNSTAPGYGPWKFPGRRFLRSIRPQTIPRCGLSRTSTTRIGR